MARQGEINTNTNVVTTASNNPLVGDTISITASAIIERQTFRFTADRAITIDVSGTPVRDAEIVLMILNDGVLPRTITLGANLSGTAATIVGTANKEAIAHFISNGAKYLEVSRSLNL